MLSAAVIANKFQKGMIKMYAAEVLGKFPVVQHFPFGSLLSWDTDPLAPSPNALVQRSSQSIPGARIGAEQVLPSSSTRAAHQLGPGITKAPWTSPGAGTGQRGPGVTAAPWATARPTGAVRRPEQVGDSISGVANPTMMPPTRAPWARPP